MEYYLNFYNLRLCEKWKIELIELLKLALPTMLTQLLRFINPAISVMICGHMSTEELDAASMAIMLINVLGLCVMLGFSTAFDTLFSQAHGTREARMLEIFLQRAICVVWLMFSLLTCLLLKIEPILIMLKQDPLISSLTIEYLRYFLPGLACDFLFVTLARYLQAQNIVLPMVYASITGTLFNICAQYLFVVRMEGGLRTSAICLSCAFAVMLLAEISYLIYRRLHSDTLAIIDLQAMFRGWGIILRMGIPGILMVSLEEWSFELTTFLAGYMGQVILGAHSIAFQLQSIIYMIPLGLFTAVNIRVGQKLGAHNGDGAQFTYHAAFKIIAIIVLSTGIPIILLRSYLPYIFTEDDEVASVASKLLPLLLPFQLCEGFAGVSEAVLLACGKQKLGAIIIFVGYYCIGIPIACLLVTKTDASIFGAWIGLLIGFLCTTVTYTLLARRTDWSIETSKAQKNIYGNFKQTRQLTKSLPNAINDESANWLERMRLAENGAKLVVPKARVDIRGGHQSDRSLFRNFNMILFLISQIIFALTIYSTMLEPEPLWHIHCTHSSTNLTAVPSYCRRLLS